MNSSVPDYKSLYRLQDQALKALKGHLGPFYLTGGTALGRFYLNHRLSDDLDFRIEWLPEQRWLKNPVDLPAFKEKLNRIADDFLLANDNSLGVGKTPLEKAMPGQIAL